MQRKIRRIYCDTAAATPLAPAVFRAMEPWFKDFFGNPSSLHQEGLQARAAVEAARSQVASFLNVNPDEITFTGSGSEANNLALLGLAQALTPGLIVISALEHSSIRNCALELQARGWRLEIIKPKGDGVIDSAQIREATDSYKGDTVISITLASNEIGTLQPIKEIAKTLRQAKKADPKRKIIFHTDACQAARFLSLDPAKLGVDTLTFNGAKMSGPKGIGVLWLRRDLTPRPQIFGGGQEGGRRSGTEAVAQIVGLGTACLLVKKNYKKENDLEKIQKYFIDKIQQKISDVSINGTGKRLPHIVNLKIDGVRAEHLVIELDARGIAVSAGSACSSHKRDSSYVIMSLGQQAEEAQSAVRFSFPSEISRKDIDFVVSKTQEAVARLRSLPQF